MLNQTKRCELLSNVICEGDMLNQTKRCKLLSNVICEGNKDVQRHIQSNKFCIVSGGCSGSSLTDALTSKIVQTSPPTPPESSMR
jgi:hypothetical protein